MNEATRHILDDDSPNSYFVFMRRKSSTCYMFTKPKNSSFNISKALTAWNM